MRGSKRFSSEMQCAVVPLEVERGNPPLSPKTIRSFARSGDNIAHTTFRACTKLRVTRPPRGVIIDLGEFSFRV